MAAGGGPGLAGLEAPDLLGLGAAVAAAAALPPPLLAGSAAAVPTVTAVGTDDAEAAFLRPKRSSSARAPRSLQADEWGSGVREGQARHPDATSSGPSHASSSKITSQ